MLIIYQYQRRVLVQPPSSSFGNPLQRLGFLFHSRISGIEFWECKFLIRRWSTQDDIADRALHGKNWSAKLMEFGVERGGNSDEGCLRIYTCYIWMRLPQEVNNPQKKVGVATNVKPMETYVERPDVRHIH